MWRLLFIFVLAFNIFVSQPVVHAQTEERFAECDLCGYCKGKEIPANWLSCKRCLYPDVTSNNAADNRTLVINPDDNTGPTPKLGRHYTMIGCLKTDLDDFTSSGAAGNVVQTLLDLLFKVAGAVAFLYLMYGSFIIITSQGDVEKLNYGRRIITGAIVGLIFSLSSLLIIGLLGSGVLKIPGFSVGTGPSPIQ